MKTPPGATAAAQSEKPKFVSMDADRLREFYAIALVRLKSDKALPIILRHLDNKDTDIFGLLEELNDPRAIEPLRGYLKQHPGESHGARGRLALARLEAKGPKDLAARVLALLETERDEFGTYYLIEALGPTKDPRAVPHILKIARVSENDMVLFGAFGSLGKIGGDEAVRGLIELLKRDYSKVETGKPMNVTFQEIIAWNLHAATGQDLGTDPKLWEAWLAKNPPIVPAPPAEPKKGE